MIVGIHMVLISEFTISKHDVQPLKKCLWFIMVSVYWCSYGCIIIGFHYIKVSVCNFIRVSNMICTVVFVVILRSFVCACILCTILGHRRRRGQADSRGFIAYCGQKGSDGLPWVHRLLCGLPRVHRGPRTLLPGTPFIAGLGHYSRAPHSAVIRLWPLLPVEWMDVLRPCWDGVSTGVMMLWSRGTTLLIGA